MPLKQADFVIVPEDLIAAVLDYSAWLEGQGFKVTAEPTDLAFPNTPVLMGSRATGQLFFYEVSGKVNVDRAAAWVNYGKASSSDVRYVVVVANGKNIPSTALSRLKKLGVGVHLIDAGNVEQLCHPHDLSLTFEFPSVPKPLVKKLASARDLFGDGHWKEAYEDACQALESDSRAYMAKRLRMGASFVSSAGKSLSYTEAQINKATLGSVGKMFLELVTPTQAESQVGQAIGRINPRRITVAHFKSKTGKRARQLRDEVGKDLIVIVNAMMMLR